jgi:hypothetical protein
MYMKHPTTLYTVKCGKCMISPTRRLRAHAVTLLHLFPVSWTIGFCRERLVYVGWSGLLLLPHSLPDSLGGWFTWITFVTGSYTHSLASSPLQRSGLLGTNSGLRSVFLIYPLGQSNWFSVPRHHSSGPQGSVTGSLYRLVMGSNANIRGDELTLAVLYGLVPLGVPIPVFVLGLFTSGNRLLSSRPSTWYQRSAFTSHY